MTWRDELRPASFRGVEFKAAEHELSLGRRFAVYEYPLRDDADVDDMGRAIRVYNVDGFVIGPDYMAARDALINALEAPGTGVLIHPWLGRHTVALMRGSVSESSEDGGMARFRLEFIEPRTEAAATETPDTQAQASDAADDLTDAATADFADRFDVIGYLDFVADTASATLTTATDAILDARTRLTGSGSALSAFVAAGLSIKESVLDLVRAPVELATSISRLVHGLRDIAETPAEALGVLKTLSGFGSTLKPVVGSTAARLQQAANQRALTDLVSSVAAAEAVKAMAETDFASYQDAVAARNEVADLVEALAERAADDGRDAAYLALNLARQAMVRDINARAADLAKLYTITPVATVPALVLAHSLYGPLALEDREVEIIARNRIAHPSFVPGGRALEVLSDV